MSVIRFAAVAMCATAVISSPASAQATAPAPATSAITPPAAPPPPATIDIGRVAPDFTLAWADSIGARKTPLTLSSLKGKVVVLAFYPGDRSSGCTAELTKFRDEYSRMFGSNTVVIPISVDSIGSHASWSQDMKFPFALASDPQLTVAYGFAIQTDVIFNQLDPARFVPGLGPAQLHRAQFKSTITWTAEDGTKNSRVIYIGRDHYHSVW